MTGLDAAPVTRRAALLVAGALFMEHFDATVLIMALPAIGTDLNVSAEAVNLAITTYLVAVAVSIPFGGWLTGRIGPRAVFLWAIAGFGLASAMCALAPELWVLCVSRAFQGVAGGLMVPVGRLVVLRATAREGLVGAIALLTWPALVAPLVAPLAGSLLVTFADWRWIFAINIPFAALCVALGLRWIIDRVREPRPLDAVGLLLTAGACASALIAFELVGSTALPALIAATAAVALGTAAIMWLRRARHPLVDLSIFRDASFRVANSTGLVFRVAISAIPFLLPLMLQEGFGWSALLTGVPLTGLFLGNLVAKSTATRQLRRWGFRGVAIIATGGAAASVLVLGLAESWWSVIAVTVVAFASGWARSLGFTTYNTLQFADVDRQLLGSANTLSAMLVQLAQAAGVTFSAVILRQASEWDASSAYRVAFGAVLVILVVSLIGALRTPGRLAWDVSSATRRPV
jgi:MFS family permease